MNYLTDLMECLRPDDFQGDIDAMLKARYDIKEEEASCDYCKSYGGEKSVARFVMKDLLTGKIEVVDLCDDCINEDAVFLNKKIIDVIILYLN